MSNFDALSNSIEIYFRTAAGKVRSIQSIARGINDGQSYTAPEFVNFVDSVSIKLSLFRFTEIRVSLKPTFPEAVRLIESGVLGLGFNIPKKTSGKSSTESAAKASSSFGYNELCVRLHSGGRTSPWYKGLLLVPELKVSPDGIDIDLQAVGLLNFTRNRGTSKAYNGSTYRTVFENLSQDNKNGYRIIIPKSDSTANKALDASFTGNVQKKNWEAMKDILRQKNLRLLDMGASDPNKPVEIVVASSDYLKNQPPQIQLVAYKDINPNRGVFPILSLVTSLANYTAAQFLESTANGIYDSTKSALKSDDSANMGPERSKEFSGKVTSPDGSVPGRDPSDPKAKGKRRSVPMAREQSPYIEKLSGYWQNLMETAFKYEVTTIGVPDVLPNRQVAVNVGDVKFLTGRYDCYEIEHDWNQNGTETKFHLYGTMGLASALDELIQPIENKLSSVGKDSNKNIKESKST